MMGNTVCAQTPGDTIKAIIKHSYIHILGRATETVNAHLMLFFRNHYNLPCDYNESNRWTQDVDVRNIPIFPSLDNYVSPVYLIFYSI